MNIYPRTHIGQYETTSHSLMAVWASSFPASTTRNSVLLPQSVQTKYFSDCATHSRLSHKGIVWMDLGRHPYPTESQAKEPLLLSQKNGSIGPYAVWYIGEVPPLGRRSQRRPSWATCGLI